MQAMATRQTAAAASLSRRPRASPVAGARRAAAQKKPLQKKGVVDVRASLGGNVHPGQRHNGNGSDGGAPDGAAPQLPSFLSVPSAAFGPSSFTVTNRGAGGGELPEYGSNGRGSSLSATLERRRLEFIMPSPPHVAPKLDDGGDGGGGGKNLRNGGGGGDGGDGGGDDDDYFGQGEDGDGDGGDGGGGKARRLGVLALLRAAVPELFDHLSIRAVLAEWYRVLADLPLAIRQAVEMGLFSSAQLTRFLSMDVRPSAARAATRALPTGAARELIGRLMADPAFLQKAAFEQALAFAASMAHEAHVRGDRLAAELDLALINSFGAAFAAGAAVWVTAPSRAYGSAAKMPWQRMLSELPHNVFDASGPLRQFSAGQRAAGFFASTARLALVGAAAGGATSALSAAAVSLHQRSDASYAPSSPPPAVAASAGGLAAFMALNANLRYQLIGGVDRWLFARAAAISVYGGLSAALRAAGCATGELSRAWWQGLAAERAQGVSALRLPALPAPPTLARVKAALGVPGGAEALAAEVAEAEAAAAALAAEAAGLDAAGPGAKPRRRIRVSRSEAERRREAKAAAALAADAAGEGEGRGAAGAEAGETAALEARLAAAPAAMGGGLESLRAHALASADQPSEEGGQQSEQQSEQQQQQGGRRPDEAAAALSEELVAA